MNQSNDRTGSRVRTVERGLAALLVALLATYALGSLTNGALPTVHAAGVVAVHLAAVVAVAFPVTVVGHAVVARVRSDPDRPDRVEVTTAVVAVSCIVVGLLPGAVPFTRVLFGVALVGVLALAGSVFRH